MWQCMVQVRVTQTTTIYPGPHPTNEWRALITSTPQPHTGFVRVQPETKLLLATSTFDVGDCTRRLAPVMLLPEDIERTIFEWTVTLYPSTALTLLTLARHVSQWIIPLRYRTLVVFMKSNPPGPSPYLLTRNGKYVQHLLIGHHARSIDIIDTIQACHNLRGLAIWNVSKITGLHFREFIKNLPLERLSIHLETLWETESKLSADISKGYPLFQSLRYLDIASGYSDQNCCDDWSWLQHLPDLIHLSISSYHVKLDEGNHLCSILDHNQRIRSVIITREDRYEHGAQDTTQDIAYKESPDLRELHPRIVSCAMSDYVADWKRGALSERDGWVFAQERISARASAAGIEGPSQNLNGADEGRFDVDDE